MRCRLGLMRYSLFRIRDKFGRRIVRHRDRKDRMLDESAMRRKWEVALILGLAGSMPLYWADFFDAQRSQFKNGSQGVMVDVAIVASAIGLLILARYALSILLAILYSFAALVGVFSQLYWGYGTSSNFSTQLTRLDAIYFAIGTLTTAGTGNINATSEFARGLQTIQMMLDLALIVFAVALVMPRLIEFVQRHQRL